MQKFANEEELASKVVEYLHNMKWEVYQEVVVVRGRADIIATRGHVLWSIECKLSFTLKLIDQAFNHIPYSNYVSICIPHSSRINTRILNLLGIGVIFAGHNETCECEPPKFRRKICKAYWGQLHNEQKTFCNAGSSNGGYFTPFKRTVMNFKDYIKSHPGCSMKQAMKETKHHYSSETTARTSIYTWIREGVITGIINNHGKLFLEKKDGKS